MSDDVEANQMEGENEAYMTKILDKIQKVEAQKQLLETVLTNNQLLKTKILSSLQPKVGREFQFEDLEEKKKEKLLEVRKDLLAIAMEEKDREIATLKTQFKTEKEKLNGDNTKKQETLKKLEERSTTTSNEINKRLNKKVSFHLQELTDIKFTKKKRLLKERRKKPEHVKKKNRQNHRRNIKRKKNEQMQNRIQKIKDENIVVNISEEEMPAST